MSRRRASKDAKVIVTAGDQRVEFGFGVDFYGSGDEATTELVFAGYGATSIEAGYDDYASLDVKGKLAVVFDGTPDGMDPNLFSSDRRSSSRGSHGVSPKAALAHEHGALGVIILKGADFTASKDNAASPFDSRVASASRERFVLDYLEDDRPIEVELTAASADKLEDLLGL